MNEIELDQNTLTLAALRVLEYRGTEFNTSSQQDGSLAIAYPNFLQEVSRRIDVLFDTMPREQFNYIMDTFALDHQEILNPNYPSSAIPDYGFRKIGVDQKKLEETVDKIILEIWQVLNPPLNRELN
jgi:hypothetical protein